MVITIDGPAASGKGTAARALAARLGFDYLDTGAMYRAVAYAALQRGVACTDASAVRNLLPHIKLELIDGRWYLNGADVSSAIRSPQVSQGSSQVAVFPEVRAFLVDLQRRFAQGRNVVTEGRDQGTVVFPQAEVKFFLTATPEVRAERRWQELQQRGLAVGYDEVLRELLERDQRDSQRHDSPLRQPPDAIVIDSTDLTPQEVVERMEEVVRRWLPAHHG